MLHRGSEEDLQEALQVGWNTLHNALGSGIEPFTSRARERIAGAFGLDSASAETLPDDHRVL